jgi:hypothetical protein
MKVLLREVMDAVQLALWFLSARYPLFDIYLLGPKQWPLLRFVAG